ncbi:unnamed protein product [Microthlaspi erraticum]|uniref:Uncharacterized protein n=1 Tax=Microthlaspi erraticum TaxID=1685480 RepID=A0A6D2LEK5_9BRAS|nr:unnamed protein product [Microthlaspi erraticum]
MTSCNLSTVESEGLSGGLALFYFDSLSVNILSSSNRLIDVEAAIEGKSVFMTFVYGDPVHECRGIVWDHLTEMSLRRILSPGLDIALPVKFSVDSTAP